MQDGRKAVWSIPYVSVAFFPSLKQNFIAYLSSKMSDCIFEIHWLWQSGFIRVYSNCCCSCWFEAEIIKIGQSSHKMYSNNILNFQESTTILNAHTKKSGNLSYAPRTYVKKYLMIWFLIVETLIQLSWLTFTFLHAWLSYFFNFLLIWLKLVMAFQHLNNSRFSDVQRRNKIFVLFL